MLAGGVYFTRYQLVLDELPCITAFRKPILTWAKGPAYTFVPMGVIQKPSTPASLASGMMSFSASFAAQPCVVGSLDRVRGLRGLAQPHKAGVVCCVG